MKKAILAILLAISVQAMENDAFGDSGFFIGPSFGGAHASGVKTEDIQDSGFVWGGTARYIWNHFGLGFTYSSLLLEDSKLTVGQAEEKVAIQEADIYFRLKARGKSSFYFTTSLGRATEKYSRRLIGHPGQESTIIDRKERSPAYSLGVTYSERRGKIGMDASIRYHFLSGSGTGPGMSGLATAMITIGFCR